jgi:hypothetical protein
VFALHQQHIVAGLLGNAVGADIEPCRGGRDLLGPAGAASDSEEELLQRLDEDGLIYSGHHPVGRQVSPNR